MTLTKNSMVSAIGRRTRLRNRDVAAMLEALVEVWTDELVSGGRIELENFLVLETIIVDRGARRGRLRHGDSRRHVRVVRLRVSKSLKAKLPGTE